MIRPPRPLCPRRVLRVALAVAAVLAAPVTIVADGAPDTVTLLQNAAAPVDAGRSRQIVAGSAVQLSANIFALYLATEQHVVLRGRSAGVGLGVRTTFGTAQPDVAVAPFIRGELGRFALNAGWIFDVSSVTGAPRQYAFGPYGSLSAAFGLADLGPGRLAMDLGLDVNVAFPDDGSVRTDAAGLLATTLLPVSWRAFLEPVIESAFLRVGLRYTFLL